MGSIAVSGVVHPLLKVIMAFFITERRPLMLADVGRIPALPTGGFNLLRAHAKLDSLTATRQAG